LRKKLLKARGNISLTCETFGVIKSPRFPCTIPSKSECKMLLSEPNLPALLKYNCCKKLVCGSKGKIVVYGIDGTFLEVEGFDGCKGCNANLPLYVSEKYLGPWPLELQHVRDLNVWLCGKDYSNSIQADTFIPLAQLLCKVKLGCRRIKSFLEFERFNFNHLYPRLTVARSFSKINVRVRRDITIEAPWLCIAGVNQYLAVLCLEENKSCTYEITPQGQIALIEGRAIYATAPQCPEVQLSKAYFHGLLFRNNVNVKPCLWSRTGLLVVGWSGVKTEKTLELILALWNPYPKPRLHVLSFEQHRLISAQIILPNMSVETLAVNYNQLRIPMPSYGIRIVKLRLSKLPSFLVKK
jgi:hypothetical protein